MKRNPDFSRAARSGMTLMEVVIALGAVAFAIPLILAATGSAGSARLNAEADTRSTWIAREVHQELFVSWGKHPAESVFGEQLDFPSFASKDAPEILLYDSKGKFLAKGSATELITPSRTPDASYVVAIYAEKYTPADITLTTTPLSLVRIRVIHPAKAKPSRRSTYRYNLITSKLGAQ